MLCGILNLPRPSTNVRKYTSEVRDALHDVAEIMMEQVTREAIEEYSEATTPSDIAIAFDGTWQKRGFVSKNCVCTVTSVDTDLGKNTLEALKIADASRVRKAELAAQLATKEARIKIRRQRLAEEKVDDPDYSPDVDTLKQELERLHRELDQASSEKIQSAQYGLVLLEEKELLQQRCEELESLFYNTKNELDITQEALAKFQTTHKVTTKSGIETEESLLLESTARETSLNSTILDLENDQKLMRQELERLLEERNRVIQENGELLKEKAEAEVERKNLRAELKEIRFRETRIITDYSELEEENITLQKQVSVLKSSQVEFEGAKHEIRRLHEDVEVLQQQVEELTKLKEIAEKQMEEALQSLQAEREAKYAMKKELDHRINSESLYNLSNLAFSIRGITDDQTIGSDEDELPVLKRIEADLKTSDLASPDCKQVDLFSEIHLNEIKKLEKQIEQMEGEKSHLTTSLRESQHETEQSKAEMQAALVRMMQLQVHVQSLEHIREKANSLSTDQEEKSRLMLLQYQQWMTLAAREMEQIQRELEQLEKNLNCSDATLQLRTELTNLKNKQAHWSAPGYHEDAAISFLDSFREPTVSSPLSAASPAALSCDSDTPPVTSAISPVTDLPPSEPEVTDLNTENAGLKEEVQRRKDHLMCVLDHTIESDTRLAATIHRLSN
ncbi:hypothetical protein J6590_031039 [Homalodisca vitripennis]|nr:hypothetical protein J6590_031039 [Homalodisca vitripennis]